MNAEQQLITTFYANFQQGNWRGMLDCYHEEVFFYDPVFGNLEGSKVRAMWEMLLSNAKGMTLDFSNVSGGDGYGSCEWTATYTFPPTGRKVINKGQAYFFIGEGKIAEHHDDFNLWRWSTQALGLQGLLFGWTSTLRNGIRNKARRNLDKFIAAKTTSL
ncbi:nuclear transport factor 2 family protein [Puia dinghuensis]|uniref:Ketosteroid isomerase n=1 Tax=Puia dinghuensis TaxID=1792502 RepID=A0A8J2XRB0_9BACT|nr:nuclear transport factor 2 family protein [Puia dinghuensis]GGA88332.1 ketosteroid isomerase [Puia dinghuensis]